MIIPKFFEMLTLYDTKYFPISKIPKGRNIQKIIKITRRIDKPFNVLIKCNSFFRFVVFFTNDILSLDILNSTTEEDIYCFQKKVKTTEIIFNLQKVF